MLIKYWEYLKIKERRRMLIYFHFHHIISYHNNSIISGLNSEIEKKKNYSKIETHNNSYCLHKNVMFSSTEEKGTSR